MRNRRVARWLGAALCALALLGGGVSGCQRDSGPREMSFQVDAGLLGNPVVDPTLEVTFRAPRELLPAPPEFVQAAQREMEAKPPSDPHTDLIPTQIYADPSGEMRIFVSRFRTPPTSVAGGGGPRGGLSDAWRKTYQEKATTKVHATDPTAAIESDYYRLGPVPVLQLVIRGKGYVNFRLVCAAEHSPTFQVDYVVPTARWKDMARAVESSIGSIAFHHP